MRALGALGRTWRCDLGRIAAPRHPGPVPRTTGLDGGGGENWDFGTWRSATQRRDSRYDYVFEHSSRGAGAAGVSRRPVGGQARRSLRRGCRPGRACLRAQRRRTSQELQRQLGTARVGPGHLGVRDRRGHHRRRRNRAAPRALLDGHAGHRSRTSSPLPCCCRRSRRATSDLARAPHERGIRVATTHAGPPQPLPVRGRPHPHSGHVRTGLAPRSTLPEATIRRHERSRYAARSAAIARVASGTDFATRTPRARQPHREHVDHR